MNIALVGNPNCGKSTLFNALTGAHAKTGNWHGVTVGAQTCAIRLKNANLLLTDLPGMYSADSYSMEEQLAANELQSGKFNAVICVADALTLRRSLSLVQFILRKKIPTVLAITMADLLKKRGGKIDVGQLSARLGIPVICINAHNRTDVRRLLAVISGTIPSPHSAEINLDEFDEIYNAGEEAERTAERIVYNPYVALILFPLILFVIFSLAFAPHMPGEVCKELLENLLSVRLGDWLGGRAEAHGCIVAGAFFRAFCSGIGMLLSFLPQIVILNFSLFVLEESGYLSALAFMTDGLFRRVGLTGRAVFSVLMGFGCTAAAILTTRGLENKRLQARVIGILSYISCSAKMPVYLAVCSSFFAHPFFAVAAVYCIGVVFSLIAAYAVQGKAEESFILEAAHLQCPDFRLVLRSVAHSVSQFIVKIATVVAAVLIVLWLALSFSLHGYVGTGSEKSIAASFCKGICFLFYPMGIRQWQVALSACTGLIAKENVAGMLALFYGNELQSAMTAPSAAAFVLFIMMCSPCVSALAAAAKELGVRRATGLYAVQTALAFLCAYILYFMLAGGALSATIISVLILFSVAILIPVRRFFERKRQKKKQKI